MSWSLNRIAITFTLMSNDSKSVPLSWKLTEIPSSQALSVLRGSFR